MYLVFFNPSKRTEVKTLLLGFILDLFLTGEVDGHAGVILISHLLSAPIAPNSTATSVRGTARKKKTNIYDTTIQIQPQTLLQFLAGAGVTQSLVVSKCWDTMTMKGLTLKLCCLGWGFLNISYKITQYT